MGYKLKKFFVSPRPPPTYLLGEKNWISKECGGGGMIRMHNIYPCWIYLFLIYVFCRWWWSRDATRTAAGVPQGPRRGRALWARGPGQDIRRPAGNRSWKLRGRLLCQVEKTQKLQLKWTKSKSDRTFGCWNEEFSLKCSRKKIKWITV